LPPLSTTTWHGPAPPDGCWFSRRSSPVFASRAKALTAPVFALPWADLVLQARPDPPDPEDRDLSLDLFAASRPLSRARVLLLDDTWTTGSRAQSAAAALKLAGAARVVVVVLGRHIGRPDGGLEPFGRLLRDRRYRMSAGGLWPCPAG